jgi:hypothetical protein
MTTEGYPGRLTVWAMFASAVRRLSCRVGCLLTLLVLLACAAGADVPPVPSSATPTPRPSVSVPSDGLPLEDFGFVNGPVAEFSLPRNIVFVTKVDQPNNVAAVMSSPPAAEVADYLRRSLPAGGFVITGDDRAATTLTFEGYGWSGSFTGTSDPVSARSAVLLRPE